MELLMIDGYNIINAWNQIFDLRSESMEESRLKLMEIISNYQGYTNKLIMIIFDGHLQKGNTGTEEFYDNIKVIYTKENETADQYIERFVHDNSKIYTIRVATSDYLEQTMVLSNGGIRITPKELLEDINNVCKRDKRIKQNFPPKSNTISSNLPLELLEKLEKIRRNKY